MTHDITFAVWAFMKRDTYSYKSRLRFSVEFRYSVLDTIQIPTLFSIKATSQHHRMIIVFLLLLNVIY